MTEPQPWQLRTPAGDGEIVLWPEPKRWGELARRAAEELDAHAADRPRLLDVSLSAARQAAREKLSVFAGPKPEPGQLWIATGHQTFPYHPGVWAKSVAIDAAARAAGGAAVNLNVDHDLPHAGPQITWPARDAASGQLARRGELRLDHNQPFERQPAPSPEALREICRQIDRDLSALLTEDRGCPFDLSPPGRPPAANWGAWFATTRTELDRQLGLNLAECMSGRLDEEDSFLLFAADLIARGEAMFAAYNDSVRAARELTGRDPAADLAMMNEPAVPSAAVRRSSENALADAHRSISLFEVPLWTLRTNVAGRHRLFAGVAGGAVRLADSCGLLGEIPVAAFRSAGAALPALRRVLAEAGAALRPRALTLTLFARLLLADLFVHGIGGATYDAATDLIFERFYGLKPPPYAVASATLLLPLDVATATADQLRRARRDLRDLRFNPQRNMPHRELSREPAASLAAARAAAVERNEALRNLADVPAPARRRERADLFRKIRGLNSELVAMAEDELARRVATVKQLAERRRTGEIVLARDYFYGLFPFAKLGRLREAIGRAF